MMPTSASQSISSHLQSFAGPTSVGFDHLFMTADRSLMHAVNQGPSITLDQDRDSSYVDIARWNQDALQCYFRILIGCLIGAYCAHATRNSARRRRSAVFHSSHQYNVQKLWVFMLELRLLVSPSYTPWTGRAPAGLPRISKTNALVSDNNSGQWRSVQATRCALTYDADIPIFH